MRQKVTLTRKKTIALQSTLRITQYRAYNKFKKLPLVTFFAVSCYILSTNIFLLHIINQHSKPFEFIILFKLLFMISFLNCSSHQWVDACDRISFARFDLSTQTRKTTFSKIRCGHLNENRNCLFCYAFVF